ncbi:cupin domain-containing protein [Streptomyces luteolus]|uniref:Cupin domain-containing protein n=1 Tax=Streptomyces luteolus TaxID=3043615 RepID=A0ABT6SSE7_9ACTN|nr:cupin domain-containing protein [Streptomyces sp. B-S-A12]MDI3418515.1 cupin domain-containing protein [Streptomyces sp. B-S-A12]
MQIVKKDSLPSVRIDGEVAARIFSGAKYDNVSVSAFIVDVAPGIGPNRHQHPYEEIFVITEGTVELEAGGEVLHATPEEIVIVPAGVPHRFSAAGDGRAQMVNIHAAAEVVTEFVPDASDSSSYEYNHA